MFKKSRTLAVAAATVGVIGFGAPMASAATTSSPGNGGWSNNGWSDNGGWGGNNGGWSNMDHNRHNHHNRAIQICNNIIVINVFGGQKQDATPGLDPAYGGEPLSFLNNNCYNQQFSGYRG